jgi:hypothetical protein
MPFLILIFEPVPKLGAGKIASICPAEQSLKTQPYWGYGEAFGRSYAGQRRSKIAAHEFWDRLFWLCAALARLSLYPPGLSLLAVCKKASAGG